jgi:prophage antirepressor-like protein|nr:MAG TPA: repressor domain protein [Caudoviricetes sp.]
MNELKLFENPEFGAIRTIEEDGKVLFCGKDIASALGYSDPKKAIARHCRGGTKRPLTDSLGREQEAVFIPEGDIYRLAAKSELPGVERFESWIFDEVLPSIRRTGGYNIPKDYPSALRALADAEEEKLALLAENEQQRQAIAEFEPMKQYIDTILSSTGTMTTTQIAADYEMSAKRLNRILHEEGVQHCVNGQWILYRRHMGKGYTKSSTFHFIHTDGRPDAKITTQWTQKGRLTIHKLLTKRGILAAMDRANAMKE